MILEHTYLGEDGYTIKELKGIEKVGTIIPLSKNMFRQAVEYNYMEDDYISFTIYDKEIRV